MYAFRLASCAKVEKRHPKYLNLSQSKKLLVDSIIAIQSEQINNKADLHDTNTKMAENMLESANILNFDKMIKKV